MAPILKLSPESRTPTVSQHALVPADYQPGALPELKAISVPGLAPPPQNYPPGLRPGLHEPTGLAHLSKSARFPPSPLGDTAGQRPDRPHPRRPSPKKRPGTYNRRPAGHTLALYLTLLQLGGMHRQPPPPPSKNNRGILLRHGRPERPGPRTRPGNRRTLYQV